MKKFHIKIWYTDVENKKIIEEQTMVEHDGLTYDEICDIENHIEDIKHGIHKVETQHEKLIKLKKKFDEMPLTEYEGDYK